MFKKILFLNIIFLITLSLNAFSFEKEAEQLVQSTTDNAEKIILDSNIKIVDKKRKLKLLRLMLSM